MKRCTKLGIFSNKHLAGTLDVVAVALWKTGDSEKALQVFDEALVLLEQLPPADHDSTSSATRAGILNNKAQVLDDSGRFDAAVKTLEEGCRLFRPKEPEEQHTLAKMLERLSDLQMHTEPVLETEAIRNLEASIEVHRGLPQEPVLSEYWAAANPESPKAGVV